MYPPRLVSAIDMSDGDDWIDTSLVAFVAVGLLLGAVAAPVVVGLADTDPPEVAVVPLEGAIDGQSAAETTKRIRTLREDPSVRAVVLVANSPGGSASASESQYLAVKRLAAEKPVVASVDAVAASGAYYTILPSERIYVKPSSTVGSVGVMAPLPTQVEPNDVVVATGPNKVGSDSERRFKHTAETLKRAFANAVMRHRGEALSLTRAEVTEADTYAGAIAVRNGMADAIGDEETAIAHAAEQAGLERYAVRVYRGNDSARFVSRTAYVASDAPEKDLVDPAYLTGIGGTGTAAGNYLMIPPQFAFAGTHSAYLGAGAYANATEPRPVDRARSGEGVADGS